MEYIGTLVAGEHKINPSGKKIEVKNPFNQEILAIVYSSTIEDIEEAVTSAYNVYVEKMRSMPAHERSKILRKSAVLLEERSEQFARVISKEAGKPIIEARGEVSRAIQVLQLGSEAAKNLNGEQIVLDSAIGGEKQIGFAKRVPLGVIAAITPFNFPLNLVLHKIAPAIAVGNTVVLKPAEKTPMSSVLLHQLLKDAGLPAGALNILNGYGVDLVKPLVTHPKVKKVTFTGSGKVGWHINEIAKNKIVTLELGSNAPNIIFDDADLDHAAAAIALGGYTYAGQACVSAQRIYVHKEVYKEFVTKLQAKIEGLIMGDPSEESTQLGPMITEEAAIRAETWIKEAVADGATIRTGGKRNGTFLEPTIMENVQPSMNIVCMEVFAPIVAIIPFEDDSLVVEQANDTEYGLQAGIFTSNINRAFKIADQLEMGGVWINEVSVRRYDHIPYGGVKQSGVGKEGIRYAVDEMSDLKFIGLKIL